MTPVIARADLFALGVFHVQDAELSDDVRYDRLRGVGLALGDGGLSLGAMDRERVIVDPTPEGVFVVTPRVEFMTGRLADARGPAWLLAEYTGADDDLQVAEWPAAPGGVAVIESGVSR